jgi:hypothetical protein
MVTSRAILGRAVSRVGSRPLLAEGPIARAVMQVHAKMVHHVTGTRDQLEKRIVRGKAAYLHATP